MPDPQSRTPSRQAVKEMARLMGLELTEEQLDRIRPDMEALARNVAALQALELGESEPALVFHPDLGAE